jgi:DNA-binding NarL/FixJ family response regulator
MSEVHSLVLEGAAPGVAAVLRPHNGRSSLHPSQWDGREAGLPASPPPLPADGPTRVYVYARDGILRAGVASQLRRSPQVRLTEDAGFDSGGISIVAADEVCEELIGAIRAIRRTCTPKVIVIANRLNRSAAEAAIAAGAWAFMRRADARPDRLVSVIRDLAQTDQPPTRVGEALGDLVDHLEPERPAPPARPGGLSDRDVEVLRMMADGQSTAGIAQGLSYSESTIKNIIHVIVRELGARNRAHAVAMALRADLI